MRFQFSIRLISVSVIALAGALWLSISARAHDTLAQATVTVTVQSTSTPTVGIPLTYTVQSGDTFNSIAQRFNLTPQQLEALNDITNVNVIRVGQVLTVSVSLLTPNVEPTQRPAFTPTGTATRTATPLPTTASTATPLPIKTVTTEPTAIATLESFAETAPTVIATLESFEQPTPASPLPTYVPRATIASKDIPPDVIVVGILICLIVVAIILGLRLRL